MTDTIDRDIEALQKEINTAQTDLDQVTGAIKVLKTRLQEEFSLKYSEDSKKCEVAKELRKLDRDITKLDEKKASEYKKLKDNYDW